MIDFAIIGDRFMRPEFFQTALAEAGLTGTMRSLELAWPDEPLFHGYAARKPGLEALKEYFGDPDQIAEFIGDAAILVNHLAPVTAAMLERLPNLRLIAAARGGAVNIDMAAARRHGVKVVNSPGRNASAVAEFTVAAILAETRLVRRGHEAVRQGQWPGTLYRADLTGRELCEMTVGIVGYGQVGTRVVRLLKPFGCRLLVCDPYVDLGEDDRRDGVAQVTLDDLLARSDVISLHARVTAETTGFIAAPQFARMPKGAYFINTARGPLVDYDALYQALAGRHLAGAMLDTFAVEPVPPDWPLLSLDSVTLTPHIAGASLHTAKVAAAMVAEEVRRHLAGEPPLNPLD